MHETQEIEVYNPPDNAALRLVTGRGEAQISDQGSDIATVQKRLKNDYERLEKSGGWRAVGALYDVSGALAYRIANQSYEPRDPAIRLRLGLPVALQVNIFVFYLLVVNFYPNHPTPRLLRAAPAKPRTPAVRVGECSEAEYNLIKCLTPAQRKAALIAAALADD